MFQYPDFSPKTRLLFMHATPTGLKSVDFCLLLSTAVDVFLLLSFSVDLGLFVSTVVYFR
jgi:hypothetical protein